MFNAILTSTIDLICQKISINFFSFLTCRPMRLGLAGFSINFFIKSNQETKNCCCCCAPENRFHSTPSSPDLRYIRNLESGRAFAAVAWHGVAKKIKGCCAIVRLLLQSARRALFAPAAALRSVLMCCVWPGEFASYQQASALQLHIYNPTGSCHTAMLHDIVMCSMITPWRSRTSVALQHKLSCKGLGEVQSVFNHQRGLSRCGWLLVGPLNVPCLLVML